MNKADVCFGFVAGMLTCMLVFCLCYLVALIFTGRKK